MSRLLSDAPRVAIEAVVLVGPIALSEFYWIDNQDVLLHRPSPSLFSVNTLAPGSFCVLYRPGPLPRHHAVEVVRKWEDVLRLASQWLRYIERDVSHPQTTP
jgi:hypothetical protein